MRGSHSRGRTEDGNVKRNTTDFFPDVESIKPRRISLRCSHLTESGTKESGVGVVGTRQGSVKAPRYPPTLSTRFFYRNKTTAHVPTGNPQRILWKSVLSGNHLLNGKTLPFSALVGTAHYSLSRSLPDVTQAPVSCLWQKQSFSSQCFTLTWSENQLS